MKTVPQTLFLIPHVIQTLDKIMHAVVNKILDTNLCFFVSPFSDMDSLDDTLGITLSIAGHSVSTGMDSWAS